MKRLLILVGLAVCVSSSPLYAQEPPEKQLEFVRKLRERGYADLALEYLEGMKKTTAPGAQSGLLLETARTRVALARKLDPEQRVAMVNRARGELQEFLKSAGSGEALAARLEIARLSTFQGQALLSRALREEGAKAQQQMATPAEQMFIQAGKEIEEATKALKDEDEIRQAHFDLAINMMDQARTYIDLSGSDLNTKRAQIVDKARKIFEKVYEDDKKGAVGMLAAAWLVKCCQEGDDPKMANTYYTQVMAGSSKSAEPAQRWARYFRLEGIPRNVTLTKLTPQGKLQEMQKEAQAWLKEYPGYHKTPAGYGVRFELANALIGETQFLKDAKLQASRLKQAQDILGTMNESDNDFAEKANQLNVSLSIQRVGEKTSLADLSNFDECYLRAQVELSHIKKVAGQIEDAKSKDDADKLEKQRKAHFKTVIRALSRGLAMADTRVAPSKLDEARYLLVASYLMSGDMYRAAIAGEAMARAQPPTKRSPLAAGYAIEAYANIFSRDNSENNRARLNQLTDFVLGPESQKIWANDPVTGVAHYQLAMLLNKAGDYEAAEKHLLQLPKDFPGYLYAQGQLVFIALEARDKAQKPEVKKAKQDLARKVIAGLGKLPAGVDGSTATIYFHAQLEEAKFLYADAGDFLQKNEVPKALQKYQQMGAFLDGVTKDIATAGAKMDAGTRENLVFFLGTLRKYARLGLAEVEYRNGQYDKVLGPELTGPVVEEVKKEAAKNPIIRLKDFQVTGDILGLALRANVQKGKIEEAKQILKLLENLKGTEDGLADSSGVLRNLVGELQIQVRALQKAGDQAKLKQTVANFSEFLDALVKQAEKKGMDKTDLFFLARCYDSLDQHEKAAGLYARYPAPKFLDVEKKEKDKFKDEEEKELQTYWYVQVRQAQQLRLAKKLDDADKILKNLQGHKNARQHLNADKEQNHLFEDRGLYGLAIGKWGQFMNNPTLKKNLANDATMKEIYFDSYYHLALCWYRYSQTEKVKTAGKDAQFLAKAADYIIRLENSPNKEGWEIVGPKFRKLMQEEKMLDDAYKRQKGA